MEQNTELLNLLIELLGESGYILISGLLAALTYFVRRQWTEFIKNKPENVKAALEFAASLAVTSAEVAGKELQIHGEEKMGYALKKGREVLDVSGYKNVSLEPLEAAILKILYPETPRAGTNSNPDNE